MAAGRVVAYSRASWTISSAARPVSSAARCGRPFADAFFQVRRSRACAVDVVAVFETFRSDHVHHGEGERGVGAGADGVVAVGELAGAVLVRIDGVEPRAVAARFDDEGPEMDVGAEDVGAPGEDQFGVAELLGLDAVAEAEGVGQARGRPAEEQMVRSSRDAPRRWKKRRSMPEPLSSPMVPA